MPIDHHHLRHDHFDQLICDLSCLSVRPAGWTDSLKITCILTLFEAALPERQRDKSEHGMHLRLRYTHSLWYVLSPPTTCSEPQL